MFFRSSWNDVNMKSALQNLEGNAPSSRRRYRSSGNVWVTGAETPGDVTSQVTVEQGYTQAPDHVLRCPAPSHTQLRQFNTNGPLIHVPSFLCVLGSLSAEMIRKIHIQVSLFEPLKETLSLHCIIFPEVDLRNITWLALLHFHFKPTTKASFYLTECFICKFCPVAQ